MAVTRRTQKDVGSYEPKFIGPFNLRQSIAVGIGGVLCLFACYGMKTSGTDVTTMFMVCFTIMVPFFAFGWVKPYGMKLEQFALEYYKHHIEVPSIRKYETVTALDEIDWHDPNEDPNDKNKKNSKPVHKKDAEIPDYL